MSTSEIVKSLDAYGLWAIITFLGMALIYKDKQLTKVLGRTYEIIETTNLALQKLDASLNSLKNVIMTLKK